MTTLSKEVRNKIKRSGFDVVYLPSYKTTPLARKDQVFSPYYVSDYSVNVATLENEIIPFIYQMSAMSLESSALIFDEIGRMQNMSPQFLPAVDALMQSTTPLVATIVYDNEAWAQKYKEAQDIFHVVVTSDNRHVVPNIICDLLVNAKDFACLSQKVARAVLELFHKYWQQNRFAEVHKLIQHTIGYLASHKVESNKEGNSYRVYGKHGIKTVMEGAHGGYTCTCDFYADSNGSKECSHIQTVHISSLVHADSDIDHR